MKIVHVCISSNVFGENYAYQDNLLSKYHKKLGHDVTVIAPTYSAFDKNTGSINSEPVGVKYMDNGVKLIRLKPLLPCKLNQHFHMFRGLNDAIEQEHPDLIFCHSMGTLNYTIFPKYKKTHPEVRIVFDNHADYINSWHSKLSYWDSRYVQRNLVVKRNVKIADWFYGVTPIRCDVIHDVYGVERKKIKLLPMGADDEELELCIQQNRREILRRRYAIRDDDFLIVTGGKIDQKKNVHVLANAVSEINNPHVKLLIFGNIVDYLKPIFQQFDPERIIQVGWVPSNEVYHYFLSADLVMFPGLHSVLWEQAVASKMPCAFSKLDGFTHIDFGGNCILLEEQTSDYYQSIIEKVTSDREFYDNIKNTAASQKSNTFLYSHIAQQVIDDNSE